MIEKERREIKAFYSLSTFYFPSLSLMSTIISNPLTRLFSLSFLCIVWLFSWVWDNGKERQMKDSKDENMTNRRYTSLLAVALITYSLLSMI